MSGIKMVCKYCGGENISRDACVMWNVTDQRWEVTNLYDSFYCADCENEAKWCEINKITEEPV
jgi:hypothetical protein